jgi:hypothetical protein
MLIADHARKDVPLGSYSWKYITESVKAGFVQVEDKYLNGPPPGQPRSILAGSRAKKTRTPFSEHDDAILAKHVLQKGIDTAGNKMYMELEALVCLHFFYKSVEENILIDYSTPIILINHGDIDG